MNAHLLWTLSAFTEVSAITNSPAVLLQCANLKQHWKMLLLGWLFLSPRESNRDAAVFDGAV